LRRYPNLYQINARTFINQLSGKYQRPLSLLSIPESEWQSIAGLGFDIIWLMGVWQSSPIAKRLALQSEGLLNEFNRILPGWRQEDVSGSPYAIYDYRLDSSLGGENELTELKTRLNHLGLGLVLDFVPNHLAMDHPWTFVSPDRFVHGRPSDVKKHPDWFFPIGGSSYLAHGRDPYFASWNDTAQVNFFSNDLRQALLSELDRIAGVADGVRCDMAMLALNDVFKWVWGEVLGDIEPPSSEFWSEAIGRVKQQHPGFVFLAEVYWGLDRQLLQMGFDFTYDKPFYDHLLHDSAEQIAEHLRGEAAFIGQQAHFIENHDEARALTAFGRNRSMAAALITATLPGLHFYQHGQLEGRAMKTPVQLVREPVEPDVVDIYKFYRQLLSATNIAIFHEGEWIPLEITQAWLGNNSHRHLLAWQWSYQVRRVVIVINYSQDPSQAWIKTSAIYNSTGRIILNDILSGTDYVRDTLELSAKGLYVDLKPYRAHFFDFTVETNITDQT
jgi:hypothetical protein